MAKVSDHVVTTSSFPQVGTEWEDVCEEIRKAHYQPLLLVYTNPFGEELDLSEVNHKRKTI